MATEESSSELIPRKRQRRLKQDPQFIFDIPTAIDSVTETPSKRIKTNTIKPRVKSAPSVDEDAIGADLYVPGDIVWSKLGSFPWWPALIYRCDAEDGMYTRTLNSNSKTKRQFFVYFYGKYLEYAWLSTRSLLKYAGLNSFIENAETAVQQASTKSEKLLLANRYQLKVSMKKRVQWDEAIELADRALPMTKDERIKQFSDLWSDTNIDNKKYARRTKISINHNHDLEKISKSLSARASLLQSVSFESPNENNNAEKSEVSESTQRRNYLSQTDIKKDPDEKLTATKPGRKRKSSLKQNEKSDKATNLSTTNTKSNYSIRRRINQQVKPIIHTREIKDEYLPSSNEQRTVASFIRFIHANTPPLSNFEEKQIVESLLTHEQENTLTFDEAQTFAMNKAREIVLENHNYRMDHVPPEWFYDAILLKYPSIAFKYRSWFENINPDMIPDGTDLIQLKQWLISLMIQAKVKAEQ